MSENRKLTDQEVAGEVGKLGAAVVMWVVVLGLGLWILAGLATKLP